MHFETQIEEQLIRGLKRMAVPYRTALEILREHYTAATVPTDAGRPTGFNTHDHVCALLRSPMEMIADYEQTVAPLRTQWNSLHKTPGSELQRLMDEQSVVLQELIELLNCVEQQMLSSRTKLAKRLDESQRQTAMRQAYQSAPAER